MIEAEGSGLQDSRFAVRTFSKSTLPIGHRKLRPVVALEIGTKLEQHIAIITSAASSRHLRIRITASLIQGNMYIDLMKAGIILVMPCMNSTLRGRYKFVSLLDKDWRLKGLNASIYSCIYVNIYRGWCKKYAWGPT